MEISKTTKTAHTSVKNNLNKLVKLNVIKKSSETKGKRKFPFYKSNLDSEEYKKFKKIYNLASLFELAGFLNDSLMPKCIVLFGSYQRGEDTEESDIDLFIECKRKDVELSRFEKQLKRKIQLHFNENFTSLPNEMKNNIINGVVLKGFLEGYK
jgi:predicted nucleotidyltransferase